ncbi:MAG: hypothetical protein V4664_00700 [Patescibacteria group bacterium]
MSGYFCEIKTDDNIFFQSVKNSGFWKVYATDVEVVLNCVHPDVLIEISLSIKDFSFTESVVFLPLKRLTIEDVITVVDYIYERHRNSKGIYTVNSSSVVSTVNKKSVIFFGGSTGMGKTTLARFFSNTEHFSMYSDDKTLIDIPNLKLSDGSNYIHINKKSLEKEFGTKNSNYIEFNNEKSDSDKDFNIALFVYGYCLDSENFKEVEIWDSKKFEWHLYESVTKRIRGTTRRIINGTIALPSLDTDILSEKRIRDVKYLCSKIPCIYIKENPKGVFDEVFGIISKI